MTKALERDSSKLLRHLIRNNAHTQYQWNLIKQKSRGLQRNIQAGYMIGHFVFEVILGQRHYFSYDKKLMKIKKNLKINQNKLIKSVLFGKILFFSMKNIRYPPKIEIKLRQRFTTYTKFLLQISKRNISFICWMEYGKKYETDS